MQNQLTDEQEAAALFSQLDALLKPYGWPAQKLLREYVESIKTVFCAMLAHRDAEIAALKLEESQLRAAAIYTADLCTQALDDIKLKDAEIAALRNDKAGKVLVDPAYLILTTANHGGYREGMCVVCRQSGWLDIQPGATNGIRHLPDCVVGKAIAQAVQA